MIYVWWTLTVALMLAGLVGTVVPVLPGTTIILSAAILFHFTVHSTHSLGWWPIGGLGFLTVASYAVDLASGTIGAKWGGATKWGAIGGLVGTVVGLFFGIVGIFVAPLIGVLLGEWLSGRGLLPATKSTWGSFLGTTAGIILRFIIGVVMIVWFFVAVLWSR